MGNEGLCCERETACGRRTKKTGQKLLTAHTKNKNTVTAGSVLIKSDADNRLCEELQSMAASSIVLRTLILSHQFLVGFLAGVGLQLVISLDVG